MAQPQVHVTGTVYGLLPEHDYQVVQSFKDVYGNVFESGQRLHFKQRNFSPHYDGHTLFFAERLMYLPTERTREVLADFSAYIAAIKTP